MRTKVLMGLCIAMVFISTSVWALSPPPYYLQRQILDSVGASPLVNVGEVVEKSPGQYVIDVNTSGDDIANSLAFVLLRRWVLGNETVVVRIYRPDETQVTSPEPNPWGISQPNAIEKHFQTALRDNPLFVTTHRNMLPPYSSRDVWVEVAKEVIQFWNDDLSDYYGNTNLLARDVFAGLFNE